MKTTTLVDWLATELHSDRRLTSLSRDKLGWAIIRACCMHRDHTIDVAQSQSHRHRKQTHKLRFQVACKVPDNFAKGDPLGTRFS